MAVEARMSNEQERALLNPGVMIAPGGEGEQHDGAEEVVDTEQENHANRHQQRNDEIKGADSRKVSPRRLIDNDDDRYDDADVKDRTQREIGQKRQRADNSAGVASQHESFERNEAGRAHGTGQTAAHRGPVQRPGVEGPEQEARYDARQEEAKDRLTWHPGDYRPPRAPRRRSRCGSRDLSDPRRRSRGRARELWCQQS